MLSRLRSWLGLVLVVYPLAIRADVAVLNFARVELVNEGTFKFVTSVKGALGEVQVHELTFSITEKGRSDWETLGQSPILGPDDQAEQLWVAKPGQYQLKVAAADLQTTSQAELTFEVFTDQRRIRDPRIASAVNQALQRNQNLNTGSGDWTSEDAELDTLTVFWSGGNTRLARGFTAPAGTFFWAVSNVASLYQKEEGPAESEDIREDSSRDIEGGAIADKQRASGSSGTHFPATGSSNSVDAKKKSSAGTANVAGGLPAGLILHRPNGTLTVNPTTLEGSR